MRAAAEKLGQILVFFTLQITEGWGEVSISTVSGTWCIFATAAISEIN